MLLAQVETSIWALEPGSWQLYLMLALTLAFGFGTIGFFMFAPPKLRRPLVWTATFLAGLFWVVYYFYPVPIAVSADQVPLNTTEAFGFWLNDSTRFVSYIAQVLDGLLLGLGIFSLVKIHSSRLMKKQKDWSYSLVLLIALVTMLTFGLWNWRMRQNVELGPQLQEIENWGFVQYVQDFLFDGLLQQMDAAMFSTIAFFILSAAYRAFRIRSIESTVMMASALILMLSLMGLVASFWGQGIDQLIPTDPATGEQIAGHFLENLKIGVIAEWVQEYLQVPSLRALDFGVALGALAMGLRIWLGLEKGGVASA